MKKGLLVILLLAVIIIVGLIILFAVPAPTANAPTGPQATATTTAATSTAQFVIDAPKQGVAIASPLTVSGKALNTMYFEASFPIKLKDSSGNVIAQGAAQAQTDWTTPGYVPFTATLTFVQPAPGTTGTLVLQNDNPSGDPARQIEVEIPVKF